MGDASDLYDAIYKNLDVINSNVAKINSNVVDIGEGLVKVNANVLVVSGGVEDLNQRQGILETDLQKLATAFADFVEADLKHKALALAETRIGNLRQELQIRFGFYAEIRRMATGILQSVDTGIVSDATLRTATEEVAIKAPGYWLAPALVAIASWIRDDRDTCAKAIRECLKRDDYKSTLFFMLVMRRLSRKEASLGWLERYFMHQNPYKLDREFIVVLEAITTGAFPPASRQLMMGQCKKWLDQLTGSEGFVEEQRSQWVAFFEASGPQPDDRYPQLKKFATNWALLEASLRAARTHAVLHAFFDGILTSSADLSKEVKVQLDEILSLLVSNFDDEELPWHEKVRLNELIIQLNGDEKSAQAMIATEKHVFQQNVDFLQLLTNAAFNPELAGATKTTQALAVSISQPWIVEAYDSFTAQCRSKTPQAVEMDVDGFKSSTKDGSDEKTLLAKQDVFYSQLLRSELAKLSFPFPMVAIGGLIGLIGLWGLFSKFPIIAVLLVIGGIMGGVAIHNNQKAKAKVTDQVSQRKKAARGVLRACIAEAVDYRREHGAEDMKAESVRHLLTSITAEDFSSHSKDVARNII